MAPLTDELRVHREEVVRHHMESENVHDFDAVIDTFAHPRYELIATDRGHDGKSRKVTLEVCLDPIVEGKDVDRIDVSFRVAVKLPAYQTAPRPTAPTKRGQLAFSEFAPDNPEQRTLDEQG